jgi:hypothetical protein
MDALEKLVLFAVAVALIVVYSFVIGIFVMLLWNWLMPMIFGLTAINFWQAFGLTMLCGFLFKSNVSSKSSK